MKKPIVGISMKTYNNNYKENLDYINSLNQYLSKGFDNLDIFYLPSIGLLHSIASQNLDTKVKFGAQNIGLLANGPQTGEFAIDILDELSNTEFIEIGHAERRTNLHETLEDVSIKLKLCLDKGYTPILCIGDRKRYDEMSNLKEALEKEIVSSFAKVKDHINLNKVIIAYEPYWAIGKEEAADTKYIHNAIKLIKNILLEELNSKASDIRIIYGGSVSIKTVESIIDFKDIDGVFVGRFGHDINNFIKIVNKVKEVKNV